MRAFSLTDSAFWQNSLHLERLVLRRSFLYDLRRSRYICQSGIDLVFLALLSLCWISFLADLTSGVSQGGGFILLEVYMMGHAEQ